MKKLFLIFLTVFLLSTLTLGLYLSKGGFTLDKIRENTKGARRYDKEFEIDKDQLRDINIELERGFITIKKGDEFGFYLKSEKHLDDETFEIKDESLYYKGVNTEVEVVLILPKEKEFNVDLEMNIGEIDASDINRAKVKLTIGDLQMSNIKHIEKLEVGTGDIDLKDIGSIDEISLNVGDLKLELLNQKGDFVVKNNVGDMDIYINNDFEGKINTDLGLGELKLSGLIGGDKYSAYLKSTIGDVNIKGVEDVK